MLKFNTIRKAIAKETSCTPVKSTRKILEDISLEHPNNLSFKKIKQNYQCSPANIKKASIYEEKKYDSDRKQTPLLFMENKFNSNCKENSNCNGIYGREMQDSKSPRIEFGNIKPRKIFGGKPQKQPNNSTLSFSNLLKQSKNPNPLERKNFSETQRKDARESSISKLKDKLFCMKKIISQKEKKPEKPEPTIYTNKKPTLTFESENDMVKISIESKHEISNDLDMTPCL